MLVSKVRATGCRKGQAAVEFAMVATIAMIVLFVTIQLALIGSAALALGQMNYQGARYAAVYTCATAQNVADYMCSVGSPTVTKNSCSSLTVYLNGTKAGAPNAGNATTSVSCSTPRSLGTSVTVQVSFDMAGAGGILFLTSPFLGVSFPTTLSSTETAMSE